MLITGLKEAAQVEALRSRQYRIDKFCGNVSHCCLILRCGWQKVCVLGEFHFQTGAAQMCLESTYDLW